MNARQRRAARRRSPILTGGCHKQGYSGTTPYPDLMCLDGYMRDMDADCHDLSVAALPCASCKPVERAEWDRDQGDDDDDLPAGLWRSNGRIMFACRVCDESTEWPVGPEEFDINEHANMCGGSPRCCP